MTAEMKNGKQHAISIYSVSALILVCFFAFLFNINAMSQPKQWVIVIDAGHGGRDPGAIGSYSKEKNINLAVALKTGEYLNRNISNVKVVYTRKDDSTVDLYERPKIANDNNADLFISIHTNKTGTRAVTGAETFIMGLTKDEANLAVAMKENEVMLLEDDYNTKYQGFDPKSPESYIMFTLMQNVYLRQSTTLASKIQTQLTERVNRKDRGVKQAGFWVLFNTTMPSVLVETGFISNPAEEKFLNSEEGQDYLASAIYRACRDYIDNITSRSVSIASAKKDSSLTASITEVTPVSVTSRADDLVFTVQVSSSNVKKDIKPENFKGIKDVTEIVSQGRFKYVSGNFTDYRDALKHKKEISGIYPDAFIIALRNNEIVPLQQALKENKTNK